MNIVERSSGYWVVDNDGVIDGPFYTIKEAQQYIDKQNVVVLNALNINDSYEVKNKGN
jgi:hypothetical protein